MTEDRLRAQERLNLADVKTSGKRRRRLKTWLLRLALGVLLLPIVELISWIGLRLSDSSFSFAGLYSAQEQLAASGYGPRDRAEVIHPYLGWVLNPQSNQARPAGGGTLPVNLFGFADEGPTLRKRAPGKLLVGVAGGSVAQQLSVMGEEALRRRLGESPRLKGVRIELVRLAFSGFKQPQQLMALAYVLSLGGELDVLVNIDGYNEVALAPCENEKAGVFIGYPRGWNALTADIVDPRRYQQSFRLLELRAGRQQGARAIVASPFRFSPTRNLLWKIGDAYRENRLAALADAIMTAQEQNDRGFVATGPAQPYHDEDGMFRELVALWGRSSRQMNELCRGSAIPYVHVLQPNQYVAGSKPIGPEERRIAIEEDRCYSGGVRKGYPLLVDEGKKLRQAGVDFHDLTGLFAGVKEPIYVDPFCHYNQRGNDLLAAAVADAVVKAIEGK